MRQRREQDTVNTPSHGNTIDEIDLLVSQNTTKLENLGENAVEDETSPTNQQSQSNIPSSSKSKKGVDVWAMLTELGISQPFLGEAYTFLIEQPKKLEGLIRSPNEYRKDLLLSWMRRDHDGGN
ncbi:hypothetical protein J5N97_024786 [Dioscorea zingiberensis]|uniref:Uncharacterized protein n=1 Tax=Dioscorea zingiberensis TaxID=325984 RepID=A0A9D5C7K0_9LILI|nr:hypothetical protein J5N97_024786 [Dioscorea zingiberensis]